MDVTILVFVGTLVRVWPVSPQIMEQPDQESRFSYNPDPRNPIGHTVEFKPQSPQSLRVTGVPDRSGEYILDNIHLHYGPVSAGVFNNGRRTMLASSEHTLAGRNFDGELHVELYNLLYDSLEEAEKWKDGVVVLAFFVQVKCGFVTRSHRNNCSDSASALNASQKTEIPAVFDLRMLNRMCDFYIYSGSTTTPACEESVKWVVFREPIPVTEDAWNKLALLRRGVDFRANEGISRVTQPLNEREVQSNFPMRKGVEYSLNGQLIEPVDPLLEMDRITEEFMMPNVVDFRSRRTLWMNNY
ncbi:carbonic anhydrase 2-like [Mya arenaria]|uniref:carbonic anhydrase 2-like n=1 Tax=Mya arenaria TaxID=6604 RepID=UPI0022DEEFDC|nr:carbonic anhydrase 2-like [Mya arenaria]